MKNFIEDIIGVACVFGVGYLVLLIGYAVQ